MPRKRQSDPLLTQTASEKFNLIEWIPKYDGSESLGIHRYLGKISDVANLGNWSNAEKVTIPKLKLAGIAEDFFLSYPTHSYLTEYDDIARVLISRFERTVPLSTRLQLFSSCIQGSFESKRNLEEKERKTATPPWGNAAGEFSVFRPPNTHSFDERRVHFHDSAFRDNYAAPRHSATVSQRSSRGRGNAAGFRRNTRNDNLNFRGESRF
ncbi:hypothetical protein TNCV_1984841 [Trichonephila clavipes]|nr:hypothetical protein TNCV_1984841 [Trichonephila clavipes]